MYLQTLLSVFLVSFTALAKEEEYVLELGDSDFDSRIAEYEAALVMFYAPWCGHCKRLKPEYAKAAENLNINDPTIAFIKVDCTKAGKEICNKYSISGYPTLKIFRNGKYSQDYNGPRDSNGIVKYIKAQVGPASKELKSIADMDKFLTSKKEPVVVGFFEKESDLKVAFLKLADKLREKIQFAHSSFKEVLDKQGVSDSVVLFRPMHLKNKFEPDSVTYSGAAESSNLNDFVTKNFYGLAGVRNSDNQLEFKSPLVVAYFNVDYIKNPKGTSYWRNRVLKVAKEYEEKVSFAISSSNEFTHELQEFGIKFTHVEKPKVAVRDASGKKYVMSEEFSTSAIKTFVDDFLAKNLTPFVISEPIPDSQDDPVIVAVAKNFDEVVVNNAKDTLIEFYAPWCKHCKKLAIAYKELGEKLKGEDIAIVKMDATSNDVPSAFDIHEFPTLFWIPKDNKGSPIRYNGGREVDDFIKYIAKEATNELKGWDRSGNSRADKTEL